MAMTVVGGVLGVAMYVALDRLYPLYTGEVMFRLTPGLASANQIATTTEIQTEEQVVRMAKTESVLLTGRPVLKAAMQNPAILNTEWSQEFRDESGGFVIEDAVDDLIKTLNSAHVRNTNLMSLTWSAHTPSDVPEVLSAITTTYMDVRKQQEDANFNRDEVNFDLQLKQVERDAEDLNTEITQYIKDNGLISTDQPQYSQANTALVMVGQEINRASIDLNSARTRLLQTQSKIKGALEPSAEERLEAESMPTVQLLMRLLSDLRIELDVAAKAYGPNHPENQKLKQRLESAQLEYDRAFREALDTILSAKQKEYTNIVEEGDKILQELQADYVKKEEILNKLTADVAYYKSLESRRTRLEEQRANLNSLLTELRMLRLRSGADRVILAQTAITPREKSFPNPKIIIPLCTLLLLAGTVGFVFIREMADQRVKSAADLAVVPGMRLLGVIPDIEDDPTRTRRAELVVRDAPNSVLAESYRQASNFVSKSIEANGYQSLLVVGGTPGAGSSTVVTNLAAAQAAAGRRVLIIEANFRRPSLAAAFGLRPDSPGFGDLLAGSTTIDQAIVDVGSGVHFIGAGTPANRVIERLTTGRFPTLRAQVAEKYDLIIIDAPPVTVAGDAMVLANRVDASLLVVRANQEHRGLVSRLVHQLTDMQAEFLGVILNRPRETVGGYYRKNFAAMAEYSRK